MRINGMLYTQTQPAGAEFDGNGEPVATVGQWSEPTPCLIATLSDTRRGRYEDGHFRQASYNVLIEGQTAEPENIRRVRLVRQGEDLGTRDIIAIERIATAGRTRITV